MNLIAPKLSVEIVIGWGGGKFSQKEGTISLSTKINMQYPSRMVNLALVESARRVC